MEYSHFKSTFYFNQCVRNLNREGYFPYLPMQMLLREQTNDGCHFTSLDKSLLSCLAAPMAHLVRSLETGLDSRSSDVCHRGCAYAVFQTGVCNTVWHCAL